MRLSTLDDRRYAPVFRGLFLLFIGGCFTLLTACDSGGSEGGEPIESSYSFSASGSVANASFDGEARWAVNAAVQDEDGFGINFSGSDGTDQGFLVSGGTRPEPGTYSVRDVQDANTDLTASKDLGFYFIDGQSDTSIQYLSNSGTVTITESTADRVKGEIDIVTTRVNPLAGNQQETTATLTGTFDATYAESGAGIFAPAP
ncbi:MAG: hypothetical protein GVY25_03610 [Bacteroidetes bacterium]|nr:hypothetical protein [Bacteroidota bacterium]